MTVSPAEKIFVQYETNFPFLPSDNTPIRNPILDFIEDFVVAFGNALIEVTKVNGIPVVRERIAAVIGGSLGGNLRLRLGRRKVMPDWLNRAIVSWSPASVWTAMVKHDPRREGSRDTLVEFQKPEVDGSRRDYFFRVYEETRSFGFITLTKPQPTYWYGKSFPDADLHIRLSRIARREIYNPLFRQWHWRGACEQLIFSHVENEEYGDHSTPVRYTLNFVRALLAAGEEDNYPFTGIYDATQFVGARMDKTPGRLLLVRHTGHSIHIERPGFLASEIMKFLNAKSIEIRCITREGGHIRSVGVFDHTDQVERAMTQEECILAIHRGDDLFVVGPDGDRAAVLIGFRFGPDEGADSRYFIKTEADESEPNNLLSLKKCSEP
jgi:pimeloyl-ACP methyl ester carboxylesterase